MLAQRLRTWKTVYNTANLPEGMTVPPDAVSKWLVITRAAVFSMTVTSGLVGGLLAVGAERLTGEVVVSWGLLALAIVGLVCRSRGEQHDQRLLRPRGWGGHGRLRPRPVCPAPDPLGLGDQAPARRGRSCS